MDVRSLVLKVSAAALLALAPFGASVAVATVQEAVAPAGPSAERGRMNQRVFDKVWSEVRGEYYDPGLHGVDWEQARRIYRPQALAALDDRALYLTLNRMLDLLDDDHAGVTAPAATRRQDALRTRRAALGVTLRAVDGRDGVYVVERVRKDSPASEAGIQVGWRLDTNGSGVWHPALDVREGETLVLARADGAGTVSVTPRMLEAEPAFVADRSRPGVVVLKIQGFEPGLGDWLGGQLASTDAATDVVLDLRGNPGGRLREAEAVLSCFLPRDRLWATRTSRSGRAAQMRTGGGCGSLRRPVENEVAVLLDANSRSAAELTPAALQEARRAVIVGARTAGAVLISQETRLPDGGKLILSRADFITSGGVRLEKRGVTPDIAVADVGDEAAVDAAIAALDRPDQVEPASLAQ